MDVVIAQATSKRESEGEIGQDRPELRKDCERLRNVAKDCERFRGFFFTGGLSRLRFAHINYFCW